MARYAIQYVGACPRCAARLDIPPHIQQTLLPATTLLESDEDVAVRAIHLLRSAMQTGTDVWACLECEQFLTYRLRFGVERRSGIRMLWYQPMAWRPPHGVPKRIG